LTDATDAVSDVVAIMVEGHNNLPGRNMSPAWARRGGWSLHFYFSEPHQVPHVAVRSSEHRASIRISDGELLAGELPARVLREVQALLSAHRDLATEAFATTAAFDFPGTLEEMLGRARPEVDAEEVGDDEQR